ncbi:hypothetical protein GLOIN_2v1767477 [Rhizophagus clarus]|uniref:Uncharacterized protein n=1 Tax=Rhizophagus clarus TaxID=94130 RepID=A0A8H3LYD4_9GLOM|nr:hypothetical protein GLOIN_2v1767477 [Rhizophagus clarus]
MYFWIHSNSINLSVFTWIMSILNLELQGVAIQRDKLTPEMENVMENLKLMEDICEAAKQTSLLKSELKESIQNVQKKLDQ